MISSRPIPIHRSDAPNVPRTPSQADMLSKSLGDYSGRMAALQRHISDISTITYAGYLLKRSNRPYKPVTPFPEMRDADKSHHSQPRLQPLIARDFSSSDSVDLPKSAQHDFILPQQDETQASSVSNSTEIHDVESLLPQENKVEESLQFAASFFGIELPPVPPGSSHTDDDDERLAPSSQSRLPPLPTTTVQPSAPISIMKQSSLPRDSSFLFAECPTPVRSVSDCDHPVDFLDPKDGHMWRSKYCVLEAGVLYFYQRQADAESHEAQMERQQEFLSQPNDDNPLSDSPIPVRPREFSNCPVENNNNAGCIWEKRVALDCVGAVRSAEVEYGKNSFELSAVDEDDKLILRAQNAAQMNEWLFQFHRSIAMFVMDIMEGIPAMGDLHHPTFAHVPLLANSFRGDASPSRSSTTSTTAMAAFSPRYQKMITCGTPSLSHGHGRNSLHRRRIDGLTAARSSPGTPSSVIDSPLISTEETTSEASSLVTPSPTIDLPFSTGQHFLMESSPELSAPQSAYPELERPVPSKTYVPPHKRNRDVNLKPASQKYVPPNQRREPPPQQQEKYIPRHLRKTQGSNGNSVGLSLEERAAALQLVPRSEELYESVDDTNKETSFDSHDLNKNMKLGGCADPSVISGSILDAAYISRKASVVGKVQTSPYGYVSETNGETFGWEIGAVSECGVRDSNEDSYLIVSDITETFASASLNDSRDLWSSFDDHAPGLFAIFDGHCGNEAARFAAEKLMQFIETESTIESSDKEDLKRTSLIGTILERAISSLDAEFCNLCVNDGRAWESGATALVAALVNQHLVIANLGDARGVMCRSVDASQDADILESCGWKELPFRDHMGSRRCFWQEVTQAHSPSREDERTRIHNANGWVTTEKEIPIGQLKRMDLCDEDVIDILKRCFEDQYQPSPKAAAPQRILQISRVCGELAVSRSIGDRDFKAAYNKKRDDGYDQSEHGVADNAWDCSLLLPYPDDHSRCFVGDLVSNKPDFQSLRVGEDGVSDEFLLLACDGLWDVIDSDDAIRVTRALLFEKQSSAKRAAARLAQLAIRLGSSDNVTVIVVRFFGSGSKDQAQTKAM